jgi:tRNA 2-thiouridine synthesizing protein A
MEKDDKNKETEIGNARMVLKIFKLMFFSLIRLRFYIPGIPEIKGHQLNEQIKANESPLLIDLRDKADYYVTEKAFKSYGHIPEAKLIPMFQLPANVKHLSSFKDKPVVTICPGGGASLIAAEILLKAGFKDVKSLRGGMNKWHKKGYPTTKVETEEDLMYFIEKKPDMLDEKHTMDEYFTGEIHKTLDARNVNCPVPVMKSKKELLKLEVGQVLEILTTDPGSKRDIPAWVSVTGQKLLSLEDKDSKQFRFIVKRLK